MKDLIIGLGIGYVGYMLFGKPKTTTSNTSDTTNTTNRVSLSDGNLFNCSTCQDKDGKYYLSVKGACRTGDTCVAHNY
jgi:hypothetical protein